MAKHRWATHGHRYIPFRAHQWYTIYGPLELYGLAWYEFSIGRKSLFVQPKTLLLPFFAFSSIFTCTKALNARHTYLIGTFSFVFVQQIQPDSFPSLFWEVQNATRLYSSSQNTLLLHFFTFSSGFTCTKALYGRHNYLFITICFVFIQKI